MLSHTQVFPPSVVRMYPGYGLELAGVIAPAAQHTWLLTAERLATTTPYGKFDVWSSQVCCAKPSEGSNNNTRRRHIMFIMEHLQGIVW